MKAVEIIRCKKCNAPLSLRSRSIEAGFSQEGRRLREQIKKEGGTKICFNDDVETGLCEDCGKKEA